MEGLSAGPTVMKESAFTSNELPLLHVTDSTRDTCNHESTFPLSELPLVQLCLTSPSLEKMIDVWIVYTDGSCNKLVPV